MRSWFYYHVSRLAHDTEGDFAQFALILALVVVVAVSALGGLGADITGMIDTVAKSL